jgi:hypothetical protein
MLTWGRTVKWFLGAGPTHRVQASLRSFQKHTGVHPEASFAKPSLQSHKNIDSFEA